MLRTRRFRPLVAGVLVAMLLVVGFTLAACGSDEDTATTAATVATTTAGSADNADTTDTTAGSTATETGSVSLTMLGSNQPGMELVLTDFAAEYPGITVESNFIQDTSAFLTSVLPQFAAGNGSDLVMLLGGRGSPTSVHNFGSADLLADLSSASWVPKMYEPTKPLFMYDGKVVAMDFGFCPLAILSYNKDIFAEYNIQIPSTFAELLDVCEELVSHDIVPISWGGGNVIVNASDVAVMAGGTVFAQDPDWLQKRLDGETTFAATPGWRRALDQLVELDAAGAFAPGVEGISLQDMIAQFATGKTAMMFTYAGLNGLVLQQTPDLNIGMFMFPADAAADSRVMVQPSGGLAVWVDSENQDAAKTLLDFMSQDEELDKFAVANNILTAHQANSGQLYGPYVELSDAFTQGLAIPDPTANWPNSSMNEKIGASIQGLFTGQRTVDEVLADMDTYFEAE